MAKILVQVKDGNERYLNPDHVAQMWLKPKPKAAYVPGVKVKYPPMTVVIMADGERLVLLGDKIKDLK